MAPPKLAKGYTQVNNKILEALIWHKFNGTQYAIILTVIRATYGYHVESRTMGINFFKVASGRHERQIAKEIEKLIKQKVLIVERGHSFGRARELRLNENYDMWTSKADGEGYE